MTDAVNAVARPQGITDPVVIKERMNGCLRKDAQWLMASLQ